MARQIIGMDSDGGAPTISRSVQPAYNPPPQLNFEAPVVRALPSYYSAPQMNYAMPATNFQQPAAVSAPVSQPAAPEPPVDYTKYSDNALAEVDSPFTEQRAMYNNALQKYLLDATRQENDVKTDATTALGGVNRNRTLGLTGINEDFAARGLGRSGMRMNAMDEAGQQFGRQTTAVQQGRDRSLADIAARTEKMRTDTQNNIQAARREAYVRLAANQELK